MPQSNKYDLPVLYNVDYENKMTLVNYRIKNGYIIADRVFRKARLCYTPKHTWTSCRLTCCTEVQKTDGYKIFHLRFTRKPKKTL